MSGETPCQDLILTVLLPDKRLGFEEIVRKVGYSRGTVNRHIRDLYRDKLIKQQNGRARRKYFLSESGRTQAGRIHFYEVVNKAFDPNEDAAETKAALEELKRLIDLALSKYGNDMEAFFSCVVDLSQKPFVGIYEYEVDYSSKK